VSTYSAEATLRTPPLDDPKLPCGAVTSRFTRRGIYNAILGVLADQMDEAFALLARATQGTEWARGWMRTSEGQAILTWRQTRGPHNADLREGLEEPFTILGGHHGGARTVLVRDAEYGAAEAMSFDLLRAD
jgi:hypothetical protein